MAERKTPSRQTQTNWLIDAAVFGGGLMTAATGIYFLYLPTGRANRDITLLFERATWDDLHLWGGLVMIMAALLHIIIHWTWVKSTTRRLVQAVRTGTSNFSPAARRNIVLDVVTAVSFTLAALSGIAFLLMPAGGYQGGRNPGWDVGWVLSRGTWDLVHTWSGIVFGTAAFAHFVIHWGWVRKVTLAMWRMITQPLHSEHPAQPPVHTIQ